MQQRPHIIHRHARQSIVLLLALCLASNAFAQQDFGQAPPPAQASAYPQDPRMANPPPMNTPTAPTMQSPPAGYGNAPQDNPGSGQGNPLQRLLQAEMQDYGVAPTRELQATMHGPTPTSIPGGRVITTDRVLQLIGNGQQGQQNGALVFHVLGQGDRLPGAQNAAPASQAGTFNDQTQQEFGQYLQQVTQGDKSRTMIFYCLNTQCWMSYNAALRAINMGFTNVLWYRGGIEAWQQAQQLASSLPPQGQMQGQPQAPPAGYR